MQIIRKFCDKKSAVFVSVGIFLLKFLSSQGLKLRKGENMQIVIEYVLIENFLINYFILNICEKFLKEKASLKILNSIFGAIVALCFPLFNLTVVGEILLKILVGSIMVCISFSFKTFSKYLYDFFAFALMTFVFGGAVELLSGLTSETSVFVIMLICSILYFLSCFFFKAYNKRKTLQNFQYYVRLHFNGNQIDEKGYFDSGNILYDNITNKPIILISPVVFEKLTGENFYEFALKENPTTLLKNCHYVPASTSMSQGKMLVFELDKVEILSKNNEIKEHKNIFVGLSFADFEKSFDSGLLLHSSLI